MIEPWQVWSTDQHGEVLVVSSEHHIELTSGRMVTVAPITASDYGLRHHVRVETPEHEPVFVMTDQIRTLPSVLLARPDDMWNLRLADQPPVRRALSHMVDF